MCFWRAIEYEGTVLGSYVTKRRGRRAALKVLRKLLSKYSSPVEIVTDKLGSYGAALCDLAIRHRYYESLQNLTPADVYFGWGEQILQQRERIKQNTINERRLQYRKQTA